MINKSIFIKYFLLFIFPFSISHAGQEYYRQGNLNNGYIQSIVNRPTQKTSTYTSRLARSMSPSKYGKYVNFQLTVKAENVRGKAGLWMRLDNHNKKVVGFYNMEDSRPIRGSTVWHNYKIRLYVPNETKHIVYGISLDGVGKVSFANPKLW